MDLVDFPPFYTLQNVAATRERQLALWRQLLLKQCASSSMSIDLATFPAFTNSKINRSLDLEGRKAVGDELVRTGHAEWEDEKTKQRLVVYPKTPEAWAATVYEWAKETVRVGSGINTFYEIHSGEDAEGTELQGVSEDVLLKALKVLEHQGKAQLFPAETLDEMGVKFI